MRYHQEKMITFSKTYISCPMASTCTTLQQQTSTANLRAFYPRFQTEERVISFKALKLFRILVKLWSFSGTF